MSSRAAVLLLVCLLILFCRAGFAQPYAYITNINNGTVSVIDTATNTVTTTITFGLTGPFGVAVNSAGTRVYVTKINGTMSVIDTATATVVATVPLAHAWGIAVNPAGTRVYVTNETSNSVSVIDTATNTVTATFSVGSPPRGIAFTPDGARVYVATNVGVAVIDTASNTVTATVGVGNLPIGVAVNPAGTRVYVTNETSDSVSVIDTATNTVTATVAVGAAPYGVAVNPAGTRVYVGNNNDNNVSVIDTATNTVTATVAVGTTPYGVAVDPAGTRVYVANGATDNVSVIDTATNTVTATIAVGDGPVAFGLFIGGSTAPSSPQLSVSDVSQNEGNSGTTDFIFTVSLSATPTSTVTVDWQTADDTATVGSDYVAGSGTLTWNVGDPLDQQVTVKVNGDTTVEADETFKVNLSNPSGATIDKGTGTGTILNDDTASPGISASPSPVAFANQEVGTASSTATVTVTNTGAVNLTITGITITPLGEFTIQSNTCVTVLSPLANCTVDLVFTPGAAGNRAATLLIASDASTGNYLVSLSGKGVQMQSVPIPTLSTWGLVSLSALLGMLGMAAALRRRAEPS